MNDIIKNKFKDAFEIYIDDYIESTNDLVSFKKKISLIFDAIINFSEFIIDIKESKIFDNEQIIPHISIHNDEIIFEYSRKDSKLIFSISLNEKFAFIIFVDNGNINCERKENCSNLEIKEFIENYIEKYCN